MRLTWHSSDSNSAVVHIAGNANYAKNRTPKPFDQNSFARLFVKWNMLRLFFTQKVMEWICRSHILSPCNERQLKFTDNEEPTPTITSQHCSEVDATIANSSVLPHSDWLASSDHSKPMSMLCLWIFATVSFNLTTAKFPNTALRSVCYG
jgi:hypothetical protein